MAEGPIRRACNRCHTQKLSCKRLGNEPCERCVRLKAECKSSPSLRFRKPGHGCGNGNGSSNTAMAQSSSNSSGIAKSNKATGRQTTNTGLARLQGPTTPVIAFPGPYSFDSMAEHPWPDHNIDAGLLVCHSDDSQIYQALVPPQMDLYHAGTDDFASGPAPALMGFCTSPSTLDTSSAGVILPPPGNSLTGSWLPTWDHAGSASVGMHMGPPSVTPGGATQMMEGTEDGPAAARLLLSGPLPVGHRGAVVHHKNRDDPPPQHSGTRLDTWHGPQGQQGPRDERSREVPQELVSELCDMSARLWEMSNAVPAAGSLHLHHVQGGRASGDTGEADAFQGQTHPSSSVQTPPRPLQPPAIDSRDRLPHDQCFPMDSLFALSRNFLQILQAACRVKEQHGMQLCACHNSGPTHAEPKSSEHGAHAMGQHGRRLPTEDDGGATHRDHKTVDDESFVALASSTYAALLDVYQRVFSLVDAVTTLGASRTAVGRSRAVAAAQTATSPAVDDVAACKEAAAQCCLNICRFPDVCVGGFPVASVPTMQLGLGLRLADDFLAHSSHAVASLYESFSVRPTSHWQDTGGQDGAGAVAAGLEHTLSGLTATTPRNRSNGDGSNSSDSAGSDSHRKYSDGYGAPFFHAPCVLADDFMAGLGGTFGFGVDAMLGRDASTVTAGDGARFAACGSAGTAGASPLWPPFSEHHFETAAVREQDARHGLASLRAKLSL